MISFLVEEMDIDDRWADMVDVARAPTLQTPATKAKQLATAVGAETPVVNLDYAVDVIALGAGDSILKLGVSTTVVDCPYLNGAERVCCCDQRLSFDQRLPQMAVHDVYRRLGR